MKISNKEYPSLNEYVLCKVIKYVELNGIKGAYCQLVHYDNIEALLLPSEATRNKYQRIEKIHKLGNEIICEVYNIDGTHIDLSYKSVSDEIEKQQKDKFQYINKIWDISEKIIDYYYKYYEKNTCHYQELADIYNLRYFLFWSNDYNNMELDNIKIKYESYMLNPIILFSNNTFEFDETFIDDSINELKKYIQIVPYTVSLEFSLFSIHTDGIENIKKVLHNVFDDLLKNDCRLELHSLPTYNIIYNAISEDEINSIMHQINDNLIKESNIHNCIVKINDEYKIIHQQKFILLL